MHAVSAKGGEYTAGRHRDKRDRHVQQAGTQDEKQTGRQTVRQGERGRRADRQ